MYKKKNMISKEKSSISLVLTIMNDLNNIKNIIKLNLKF